MKTNSFFKICSCTRPSIEQNLSWFTLSLCSWEVGGCSQWCSLCAVCSCPGIALAFHRHSMKRPSWKRGCNGDKSYASELTSIPGSGAGRWWGGKQLLAVSDFNGEPIIHFTDGTVTCVLCSLSQKEESNPKVFRYQHQNTLDLNDLQMELLKPKGML